MTTSNTWLLKLYVTIGENEAERFYIFEEADKNKAEDFAYFFAFTYFGKSKEDYSAYLLLSEDKQWDFCSEQVDHAEVHLITCMTTDEVAFAKRFGIEEINTKVN